MTPSDWLLYFLPDALWQPFLLLLIGLLALAYGGQQIVPACIGLANRTGISPGVVAVIVIAGGTSAPELIVSIQAALQNSPDIALGNVIGSNLANTLLVLGLGALFVPIPVHGKHLKRDSLIMIGLTAFTYFCLIAFGGITILSALLLLAVMMVFIHHIIKTGAADDLEDPTDISLSTALFLTVSSVMALLIGADLIVAGGVDLAERAGFSEAAIGLSIIAIGTSLPEIVAVMASLSGRRFDIALGNIIGSNIFNLGIVLGITGLIAPLPLGTDISMATLILLALSSLALTGLILIGRSLNRAIAFVFVGFYFLFLNQQL